MSTPLSTIIMVPREAFASTPESVTNVCQHAENGARMLVVDAGAPRPLQRRLEALAALHDFALLRIDRYLTPNQARNLAMQHVTTPYAIFVDNDVRVSSGWLEAMERCAAETGAAVVTPMTITVELGRSVVHQMGGDAHITERDGRRTLQNSHLHQGDAPEDHASTTRRATEESEFHCALVDTSWLHKLGGLDEELYSLFEHTDLCMHIRAAGGSVWFEPTSIVSYGRPRFIDRHDRRYYVLRWCEDWNARSGKRFQSVWHLDVDPALEAANWAKTRRRYAYRPFTTPFNRLGRVGRPVVDLVDRVAQRRAVGAWQRSLREESEPWFAHLASWQHG
jgi:Glycosyl transferase family 2